MKEWLYGVPSAAIALMLLALLAVCLNVGHRIGQARAHESTPARREHINGIQAAILGLLALLLAFTFSLALQRFDSRSEAVVDEANAIGTAFLRTDLLPPPLRDEARAAIDKYLDARVDESALPLDDQAARAKVNGVAIAGHGGLWQIAVRAAHSEAGSRAPMFVDSVNRLIDGYGKRTSGLNQHVPEFVLGLLLVTFLLAGGIMGFAAGAGSHRPSSVTYILIGLMVVLVFIILDLDRPRRGIINVDHSSLLDLQTRAKAELKSGRQPPPEAGGK